MSLSQRAADASPTQRVYERNDRRKRCCEEDAKYDDFLKGLLQQREKPISGKGLRFAKAFFQEIRKLIQANQKVAQQTPALRAIIAGGAAITATDTLLTALFSNKLDDREKSKLKTGSILVGLYAGYRQYQAVKPEVYNATVLLYLFGHLKGDKIEQQFENILRNILYRYENNIEILTEKSVEKFARYFAKNICYNLNYQKIDLPADKNPDGEYINEFLLRAALHFEKSDHGSPLYKSLSPVPMSKSLKWVPSAAKGKPTILGIITNSPCMDSLGHVLVSEQKMEKTKPNKQMSVFFKYPIETYVSTIDAQKGGRIFFNFFEETRQKILRSNNWLLNNCVTVKDGHSLEEYQAALKQRLKSL